MVDVVEPEAAFDAQAVVVGRSVAAVDVEDLVVLDVHRGLAADTAIGAQRIDRLGLVVDARAGLVEQALLHQCARRAHLHALAARNAGRLPHALVEVEHDLGAVAAECHADDVVGLHLAAGADTEVAVNAGVEVHGDGRMRAVRHRTLAFGIAAGVRDAHGVDPVPETRLGIVAAFAYRLVRHQQLEHHLARLLRALAGRLDFHAGSGLALARSRQHPFAFHFDHTGAAVAVRPVAGSWMPAQMRDLGAVTLGNLPDRLAGFGLDRLAIELEGDLSCHWRPQLFSSISTNAYSKSLALMTL